MVGGAYKLLFYIVSLEITCIERIGVLLWHNFKVFVFLRFASEGGRFSPLSTLINLPLQFPTGLVVEHLATLPCYSDHLL